VTLGCVTRPARHSSGQERTDGVRLADLLDRMNNSISAAIEQAALV